MGGKTKMTQADIYSELNGLMDSLDDSVTHEQIAARFRELAEEIHPLLDEEDLGRNSLFTKAVTHDDGHTYLIPAKDLVQARLRFMGALQLVKTWRGVADTGDTLLRAVIEAMGSTPDRDPIIAARQLRSDAELVGKTFKMLLTTIKDEDLNRLAQYLYTEMSDKGIAPSMRMVDKPLLVEALENAFKLLAER
jgi:hypothetical protein